jgi:hypothetical protein
MRNPHAIVLRKIRGVFGACWQGTPVRFAGGSSIYPAAPTGGSIVGAIGAMLGGLLLVLAVVAAVAFIAVALPAAPLSVASVKLPMLAGLAGTTATVEIKELTDKVLVAVAEMRAANDEKLKEFEKKGSVDPLLVARVERANAAVTELKIELDEVRAAVRESETANARLSGSKGDVRDAEVQNSKRFFSLVRGQGSRERHEPRISPSIATTARRSLSYLRRAIRRWQS